MKTILTALFLTLPIATFAQPAEVRSMCVAKSGAAEMIMQARQSGVSLTRMLEVLDTSDETPAGAVTHQMVLEAYSHPRYQTPGVIRDVSNDFRDKVHLECLRTGR